jgi:hypothetical protein
MIPRTAVLFLPVLAGLLFIGCENRNESDYREQFVLEGGLYVEHPLSVRITRTVPIDRYYDPSQVNVSGADVHIWANGREFVLPEDTLHPGTYSLPADSHLVTPGTAYEIRAQIGDSVITARTGSAAAPLHIDSTNLEHWRDSTNMDSVEYGDKNFLFYLHWNMDPLDDGYVILIENLEPDWFADYRSVSGNNGSPVSNVWIWAQRDMGELELGWIVLTCTGRYRIRVFSCDRPGYDHWATTWLGQPSNRPQSNVEGALGVFCAQGVDTAYFYLKDDVKQ